MGVSLNEFWQLTPHKLTLIAEGFRIKFRRQMEYDNAIAHLQGAYFVEALLATVGNMFSKGSGKNKYPEKPYELNLEDKPQLETQANRENDNINIDAESDKQLRLFSAQLTTAMKNFNLNMGTATKQKQGQE